MSESKSSVPSIRRAPAWETNTPQQPTIAVVQGLVPGQVIPAAQVGAGNFTGSGESTFPGFLNITERGVVGPVPIIFDASGADPSAGSGTMKIVVPVGFAGLAIVTTGTLVNLSGAAVFTGTNTYLVLAIPIGGPMGTINVSRTSASSFTLTPSVNVTCLWVAIGY